MIVPIAIIGGMPAVPVIIIAFLGNLLTITLLIVFIDTIRNWRKNKKANEEKSESKSHKRANKIWGKYGLPGLAFIGPFFIGTHLTALLAVTFGGTRSKILVLMTASIDRKSTRLNSSHVAISYAVFCLKKKNNI